LGTVVEGDKGEEVDNGEEGEEEAVIPKPSQKRRRNASGRISKDKRRKLGVTIPVINLVIEEGVEELKWEARGEEEKHDALAVEGAVRVLFGGERPNKETTRQLLEKMMRVLRAEVVEI